MHFDKIRQVVADPEVTRAVGIEALTPSAFLEEAGVALIAPMWPAATSRRSLGDL